MREQGTPRPGSAVLVGLVLVAAMVDLASKALADARLPGVTVPILPLLSLDLHHNRGVSFSMFQAETGTGLIVLLLVQCASTTIMTWWMLVARAALERVGLSLIGGGALGNLLDRMGDGAVTDFLDLHPLGWGLFTFNLADAFISVGVVLLVLDVLRRALPSGRAAGSETAPEDARR